MINKEILNKLFKIANNQQKIIQKLAKFDMSLKDKIQNIADKLNLNIKIHTASITETTLTLSYICDKDLNAEQQKSFINALTNEFGKKSIYLCKHNEGK